MLATSIFMNDMRLTVLLLIHLAACNVAEGPQSTIDLETGVDPCLNTPYLCDNSPGYLVGGMHELSLLGALNNRGYALEVDALGQARIYRGGQPYRLAVVDTEIQGLAADGAIAFRGDAAVDAVIRVVKPTAEGAFQRAFDIGVARHREAKYKVPLDDPDPDPVHFYVLKWNLPDQTPKDNACNPYQWRLGTTYDHFEGMVDGEVLLYTGDRIYPQTYTIAKTASKAHGWVTFGCAGHALAKLDLSANTRHRQTDYDWGGSQATLKLYAADYCGDGRAWTVPNTPLVWRGPTTAYAGSVIDLEARWNASGVTCLARPRLAEHPDEAIPDVTFEKIQAHCPSRAIAECGNTDPNDLDNRRRISANH